MKKILKEFDELLENEESEYIFVTSKGLAVNGNKIHLIALTTTILQNLYEKGIVNDKIIDDIITLAKCSSEELRERAKQKIEKALDNIDPVEMLKKLKEMLEGLK